MHLMDYHHHSNHSFDSQADMEAICQEAVQRNIKEICFTEHYSVNPLAPTYGHMNFQSYFSDIEKCKEQFEGLLTIKAGIELCEPHLMMEKYSEKLHGLPLDFILGSIHNIDNKKLRIIVEQQGTKANDLYFDEVYKMVCKANIDVVAHLDLIKRYSFQPIGIYDFKKYEEVLRAILEKAVERNIGIEINTSGLRTKLQQALPAIDILKLYKQIGGEILTIGSDSHAAETVGAGIDEAYQMTRECGFKRIYKFDKRQPIPLEI